MKYIFKTFLAIVLLTSISVSAQSSKLKKGNKEYSEYGYIDAQAAYLKVIDNGFRSQDVLEKLGDSYYFIADYENAAKWYGHLYDDYMETVDPDYFYRYSQSLKSMKRYEASDKVMEKFYQASGSDNRAAFFAEERDYLKKIEESPRFTISKVDFNSKLSDFAPAFYLDKLVFASNGQNIKAGQRTHDWNDQPFLDLYILDRGASKENNNLGELNSKINTKFHESTAVFSKDGETVYFTRNNFTKGSYKKDENGTNRLKLYRGMKKDKNRWDIEEVPFNSDEYSVAHPALSVDEKTLYFASDMPGGKGNSDLYKVSIEAEGFGSPVSLGDAINTKERETFPFISSDNKLYFASDGHVGLGGLDIFATVLDENNNYGEVFNIGKPVNSPLDDFTFIIDGDTNTGYFASNRKGGMGDDDIYRFNRFEPLITTCNQGVNGFVLDEKSKEPIGDAKILLLDENNVTIGEVQSAANGAFSFPLDCSLTYSVRASKEKYSTEEKSFGTTNKNNLELDLTLNLQKGQDLAVTPIEIGSDLAKVLNLNPIHFDLDRFNIRTDAAIELQKVIAVLREYPNMKIDVRSHTDSRGRDSYNASLSERRAQSTVDYIISEGGIKRSRLTGRGYGESSLINHCSNGVKCADYVHEENRRSEFIVVE